MNYIENQPTDHIRVNRFDEESANRFHNELTRRSMLDPTYPIIVYIDSFGGSADALAAMIESIESVPNKVITVCVGKAMSAGAFLLAAGDCRFCGKNSRIMLHEISSLVGGSVNDIQSSTTELVRLNDYWMNFIAKKCNLKDKEELLNKLNALSKGKDAYLDAEAAKQLGIVDFIGLPVIRPYVMYEIDLLDKTSSTIKMVKNPKEPKSTKEPVSAPVAPITSSTKKSKKN